MVDPAKPSSDQAEVVLVGCGAPGRGMGWYHAIQMLGNRCPSAKLCHIVEPWFLGPGVDSPGGKEFAEFRLDAETSCGVLFHSSVMDLPPVADGVKRLVLISGRTADNPRIMSEAIKARDVNFAQFLTFTAFYLTFNPNGNIYIFEKYKVGCHCIYLEKPGAPSVAELAVMKSEAAGANVSVWMGYNKNVCKYVSKTREFAATVDDGHVTFVSNNTYSPTPESLGECFERNSEGMLKNMAIHVRLQKVALFIYHPNLLYLILFLQELALLVSFYDVTVENIDSVVADQDFSSMQTLSGPSGKHFTDFDKIKFTIKTKTGKEVSVQADRCGGNDSYATVSKEGHELFRHSMPDDEDKENVTVLAAAFPGAMPYFFNFNLAS